MNVEKSESDTVKKLIQVSELIPKDTQFPA